MATVFVANFIMNFGVIMIVFLILGFLILIFVGLGVFLNRKKVVWKYVQENSHYYQKTLDLRKQFGLTEIKPEFVANVKHYIQGNRREFNKFLGDDSNKAVYSVILKNNSAVFDVYFQWRTELEAIREMYAEWKKYSKHHQPNQWDIMKPEGFLMNWVSSKMLYKYEAQMVMAELNVKDPQFVLRVHVEYVSPGGRDTHRWRKNYSNTEFAPIANLWESAHQKVVIEKPKSALALPEFVSNTATHESDSAKLKQDYMNKKRKAEIQARVDKVLASQKRFEAELQYNNETLRVSERFDDILQKYSKSLVKELNETKISIALTELNPELEFTKFKRRFHNFRKHSVEVRKNFYDRMMLKYPSHKAQIIDFTKISNADIDVMNHAAFDYVKLLSQDYEAGNRQDLAFCDVKSFAKRVRTEFDAKNVRYGMTFSQSEVPLNPRNDLEPMDSDVYDALIQHIEFPEDTAQAKNYQNLPDGVATYSEIPSATKKVPTNVVPMVLEPYPEATKRWEHEFDDYDVNVNCDFVGVPYKDSAYQNLVETEAHKLGTNLRILNTMRFYNLSQYLMLKSSHMLNESEIADEPMVYIIYNKSKDLVYVGQASQGFAKRFEEHLHSYHNNIAHNGSSTSGSYRWNRDLLSGDDVYFSFITVKNDSNNPGYHSMDALENAFIHIFHSNQSDYGYNQKFGNGILTTSMGEIV